MTCLIAGLNYEEQLAPFQENNMGDCPKEYLDTYHYELDVDGQYDWLEFENDEQAKEHCKKIGVEFDPAKGSWSNSNAKWDWYQVGGRWYGYFIKKQGGVGEKGEKSWMDLRENMDDNRVDIVRKGDIDIDEMIKVDGVDFLETIRPYSFIDNGDFVESYDMDKEAYIKAFADWWNSLPDDEMIVAIDYHM